MVTELFATEGGFWAALLQLFSQGTGGNYLGYFLLLTMLVAITKFSGFQAAFMFTLIAIPLLAGIGLLPLWIAALEVMIIAILSGLYIYNRVVSQ